MTVLRFGLTPKMKPVSPRRAAVVAALDIGTSKVVCMIARLEPQAPQDVLRRRSHGVRILGFAHTAASGMKAGSVVDLVEAEEVVRQFTSDVPRLTITEGKLYEVIDAAMTRLEQFAAQFEGVARTQEQRRLADGYREFIDELGVAVFGKEPVSEEIEHDGPEPGR